MARNTANNELHIKMGAARAIDPTSDALSRSEVGYRPDLTEDE